MSKGRELADGPLPWGIVRHVQSALTNKTMLVSIGIACVWGGFT
jgi:hypothetical protein